MTLFNQVNVTNTWMRNHSNVGLEELYVSHDNDFITNENGGSDESFEVNYGRVVYVDEEVVNPTCEGVDGDNFGNGIKIGMNSEDFIEVGLAMVTLFGERRQLCLSHWET
ncbi:rod shape-determining protein MreC [Sesbania bispinosa]|nr:rod shape-determining protein MreC [Sesbania bispinosa]